MVLVNNLKISGRMIIMALLAVLLFVLAAAVWRIEMNPKNISMTIDSRNNC